MNSDVSDLDTLLWTRLLVHLERLDLIKHLVAFEQLSKDGVLPVQMRGRGKGDKELAAVGVGAFVGHAHNSTGIVSQRGADLVLEELVGRVIYGCGCLGLGVGFGAAGLHHEAGDQAVQRTAMVEAGGAEGEEVLGRLGHRLAEDLELDITLGGVQLWTAGSATDSMQRGQRRRHGHEYKWMGHGHGHGHRRIALGCRQASRRAARNWVGQIRRWLCTYGD